MKKHPMDSILTGYFENELEEDLDIKVKKHLSECEVCSDKLASWASVDALVKKESISIDQKMKENIFLSAFEILDQRQSIKELNLNRSNSRKKKIKKGFELKDMLFTAIEKPAYALGALSVGVIIIYNTSKHSEYKKRTILDSKTEVYYSEGEGE